MRALRNYKDLLDYEQSISKKLDLCESVGSIALSEEEEQNIIFHMKDFIINGSFDRVKFSLLVLVVNLAYKYYNEEGFWKHFYKAFNINPDSVNAMEIGMVIEEALQEKNFLVHKREGPFRYVGTILEQTGITKKHIKDFADIIQVILNDETYYFEMQTSYERYSKLIERTYCNKYLKDFLKDESGREYTLQVAQILGFLEKRLLTYDEVINLKGFYPGFWKEFFKYYRLPENLLHENMRKDDVTLGFDPISLQIFLKLTDENFEFPTDMKEKVKVERQDGERIVYLNETKDFKSTYKGRINNQESREQWQIDGWNYHDNSIAYFHENEGFVCNERYRSSEKYYILSKERELPSKFKIINNLGKIKIGHVSFYVYESLMQEEIREKAQIDIVWEREPDVQELETIYDIFFNELPTLEIKNKEVLLDNECLLLYDLGEGPKRVRDIYKLKELRKEVKGKKSFSGKLWLQPLMQNKKNIIKYEKKICRFCIIPRFKLVLPDKVYAIHKEIKFASNNPYIQYSNITKSTENPMELTIPPYDRLLEGKIFTENKQIDFTYRLNRLELNIKNEDQSKYIDPINISDNDFIEIKGIPNEVCNLYISKEKQLYLLIENILLDEDGFYIIQTKSIVKTLQLIGVNIGRFSIRMGRHIYPLNKGVIAYSRIVDDFNLINTFHNEIEKIKEIDEYIADQVKILYWYASGVSVKAYPESFNKNQIFKEIINIIKVLECNKVIDESLIYKDSKKIDKKIISIRETLNWVCKVKNTFENGDHNQRESLLLEYKTLTWEPKYNKWKVKLEELHEIVTREENIPEWLVEWKEDVVYRNLGAYRSEITNTREGKLLTEAWKRYQQGEAYEVMDYLSKILNVENNLVQDLKVILTCIVFLNNIRISSIDEMLTNYEATQELKSIVELLNTYQKLVNYKEFNSFDPVSNNLINALPLLKEDIKVLINLNKIFSSANSDLKFNKDDIAYSWIELLALHNICEVRGKDSKDFQTKLKKVMDTIPASPEKRKIFKAFN